MIKSLFTNRELVIQFSTDIKNSDFMTLEALDDDLSAVYKSFLEHIDELFLNYKMKCQRTGSIPKRLDESNLYKAANDIYIGLKNEINNKRRTF